MYIVYILHLGFMGVVACFLKSWTKQGGGELDRSSCVTQELLFEDF